MTHNNPFWDFSLRIYAMPSVADVCIALQDEHRVDVNVLLFGLWLAARGRRVDRDAITKIDRHVCDWRERVVRPLRDTRRYLKPLAEGAPARAALRQRIKEVELSSERIEQDELFALYAASAPGAAAQPSAALARENIRAYESYLTTTFPDEAVTALVTAWAAHN